MAEPALVLPNTTNLVLIGMGVPLYSARKIKQTLTPIPEKKALVRTVNGTLIDVSSPVFKKYNSEITCTDQDPPALDGMFQGNVLTVECISELSYLTAGGSPQRPVVAGSSYTAGPFTRYRPTLVMMIADFKQDTDEWGATVGWSLSLSEV